MSLGIDKAYEDFNRLDELSRERALNDSESRALERAQKRLMDLRGAYGNRKALARLGVKPARYEAWLASGGRLIG